MTTNNTVVVTTRDNSTIAVKNGGQLLPVFPKDSTATIEVDGRQLSFKVGVSTPNQLAAPSKTADSKALHAFLSSASRENGVVRVTIILGE